MLLTGQREGKRPEENNAWHISWAWVNSLRANQELKETESCGKQWSPTSLSDKAHNEKIQIF